MAARRDHARALLVVNVYLHHAYWAILSAVPLRLSPNLFPVNALPLHPSNDTHSARAAATRNRQLYSCDRRAVVVEERARHSERIVGLGEQRLQHAVPLHVQLRS